MAYDRSIPRRRFVSVAGAAGLGVLAGCANDEAGEGEGDETAPDGDAHEEVEDEEAVPEVEGTNVFIEVVDEEDETPVPGVTVTVSGGGYEDAAFETDPDGGVILQDVEPGEYTITATTGEGGDEESFSLQEGEDANVTLEVPVPDEEPEGEEDET